MSNLLLFTSSKAGGGAIVVPPIVRPPLPLPLPRPDRDGGYDATHPAPFVTDLPWAPPATRDYLRADLWGVEMPGAPIIAGGSSRYPERILSWFLDRYPLEFQTAYLRAYAGLGYTHLYLSPPDSMYPLDGPRASLAQMCDTIRRCKQYVPYVGILIGSKYFTGQTGAAADVPVGVGYRASPAEWQAYLDPLLEAFLPIADEFSIWEFDLWCRTAPDGVAIWKYLGDRCHAAGRSCWLHFSPHYTSWQADGDDRGRFGWYDDLNTSIDGLNYQGVSNWTTRDLQDRMVDTLWLFGTQGWGHKLRLFEDVASLEYDGKSQSDDAGVARGPGVTPDDANARGYYGCCTIDNVKHTDAKVWGFGNGGRRPDGSRL